MQAPRKPSEDFGPTKKAFFPDTPAASQENQFKPRSGNQAWPWWLPPTCCTIGC